MNAADAIRETIASGQMVCEQYLGDLTDAEMLHRPCEGANHINWQLGHLISSERFMIEMIRPGSMPPLPEGFDDRYSRDHSGSNDPATFFSKTQLMELFQQQRAGTYAALKQIAPEEFEKPTGVAYAPTVAMMFILQCTHWVMHAGQWAIIRRQLGRPPLF